MAQEGLIIPIQANLSSFEKSMQGLSQKVSGVGKSLTTKLTLPIVGVLGLSAKAAADLQQTQRKVSTIFGDMEKDVWDWANESERALGLGAGTIAGMTANFADLNIGLGMTSDKALDFAKDATKTAAVLGNWNNVSADQAMKDISDACLGATKAVQKYNLKLTPTNLNERARAMGLGDTFDKLTEVQKAEVRYQEILGQSGNAFKFWEDGNRSMTFYLTEVKEQMGNIAENIGMVMLPVITDLVKKIGDTTAKFAKWSAENPKIVEAMVKIGVALAAIGPILLIIGKGIAIFSKLGVLFSPIGLAIAGVVAGVIALKVAIDKNIGGIADKLKVVVQSVKTFADNFMEAFKKLMTSEKTATFVKNSIETIKSVFEKVSNAIKKVVDFIIVPAFEMIKGVVVTVKDWFVENWSTIQNTVGRVVSAIKNVFDKIFIPVFKVIAVVVGIAIRGIIEAFKWLTPIIEPILNNIMKGINATITIINGAVNIIGWAINTIISIVLFLWEQIKTSFSVFTGVIQGLISIFTGIFTGDFSTMKEGVLNIWNTLKQGVSDAVNNLFNFINELFGGLPSKMLQWGKDAISGFVNGIKDKVSDAVNAIKNVGNKVKDAFTSKLKINSPSKVFFEYGNWTGIGLKDGIVNSYRAIQRATDGMTNIVSKSGVFDAFSTLSTTISNMSNMKINTQITATKIQRTKEFNIGARREEAVIQNNITLDGRVLTSELSPKFNVASGNKIRIDSRRVGVK